MSKNLQTKFKRIETKYIVHKETLALLKEEFKAHLVPDDYPTSTITNIYFDSADFQMIRDALARKNERKKIRMRTYTNNPNLNSPAFLEIKSKDEMGIGHKFRLTATAHTILDFVEYGIRSEQITDEAISEELDNLRLVHNGIAPMMYIYYDRFSMKGIEDPNVRVTIDHNLIYRDENLDFESGKYGQPLLDEDYVIMEVKVPGMCPAWLQNILDKHGLVDQSFSKYGNAYLKSQATKDIQSVGVAVHA